MDRFYDECMVCSFDVRNRTYCTNCGCKVPSNKEEWLITYYFRKGYQYCKVLSFLSRYHNINISIRTLKNRLHFYGLKRRSIHNQEKDTAMRRVICVELSGPSQLSGYRTLWDRLRLFHNMIVPRRFVMHALKDLDPIGCEQRRRRRLSRRAYFSNGPNDIWHLDGYDKLKQYGFPIHRCIDGYSRRILWLRVLLSNNDPQIIARLYMDRVSSLSGCPNKTRSDFGTENVVVAAMQCFFRQDSNAHLYGTSHSNQRIESWWSYFRRNRSSFWIDFFKDLVENNNFNPADGMEMACIQYCFRHVIQNDLDQLVEYWNSHYIRRSSLSATAGRPDELFFLSHDSQLNAVETCDVQTMYTYLDNTPSLEENKETEICFDYFSYLTDYLSLTQPTNCESAFALYNTLIQNAR